MKKSIVSSFAGLFPFLTLEMIEKVNASRPKVVIPEVLDDDNPEKQILGLIFAPDPLTGMPTSDISIYLSDKTNPQVRDYIQRFLMSELPKVDSLNKDNNVALDSVISSRVQSAADWREVQKELVNVANLSKEEYKTFLAQKKVAEQNK